MNPLRNLAVVVVFAFSSCFEPVYPGDGPGAPTPVAGGGAGGGTGGGSGGGTAQPSDCSYSFEPPQLDFGSVLTDTTERRFVTLVVERGACLVDPPHFQMPLDRAFTITSVIEQPASFSAPRSERYLVTFTPPDTTPSHHAATLAFRIEGAAVTVDVTGDGVP